MEAGSFRYGNHQYLTSPGLYPFDYDDIAPLYRLRSGGLTYLKSNLDLSVALPSPLRGTNYFEDNILTQIKKVASRQPN